MKRVEQFLFLLALLFSVSGSSILSQEQPSPQQFPLGVWGTGADYSEPQQYQKILESGYNWIVQGVYQANQSLLENFNVITQNANEDEWIYYYSNGMYTKWQAERDDYRFLETGFKHPHPDPWGEGPYLYGSVQTLNIDGIDHICWATDPSVTFPVDSVLWGPNYRQDKTYRLPYWNNPPRKIEYNVNYNLAFIPPEQFNPTTPVCSIYVYYRYVETIDGISTIKGMVLASDIITEGELSSSAFTDHSLTYSYPDQFRNPISGPIYDGLMSSGDITYNDTDTLKGIEFRLDWFGVGQLFIDYVEVYDAGENGIWVTWVDLDLRPLVINNIQSQLSNYPTAEWSNIKYWYVKDEPFTIDYFEPMRIVDSLVYEKSNYTWRTINQFNPSWNGAMNGDPTIQKFKELKDPEKIMMDYFPFWVGETPEKGFEFLRQRLTELYQNDPDFFYVPQGFGQFTTSTFQEGTECIWRYPTPEELKGSVMLALAHGAKGIMFWKFATDDNFANMLVCGDVFWKCLAGTTVESYPLYPMGQMIKDNLAPRLNGTLGTTLMDLSYNGDDLMLRDVADPQVEYKNYSNISYLTLTNNPVNNPINSTLNFFATDLVPSTNDYSNNYFLVTNLITDGSRVAEMNVQSSENVNNTRLRIIEPEYNFDITFFDDTSVTYSFPAGEGYLFQVAPVAIYGGKLIYDEYVNTDITLYDDMTIENGATLTLDANYYCKGNITIKDGGSIKTVNGATIQFESGKKLIIYGLASVKGTSTQKLTLDFTDPNDITGIEVLTDGDFTLSNCIVKNASTGVLITTNVIPHTFENLNINNTTFDNCTVAVNIIGSPINNAKIKNCIITNTPTGITVAYNNKITIQSNSITDSELGIFLEQTSNTHIIGNHITSTLKTMPGVMMSSSGGQIRTNTITGHTIGISLANSSPKIGGNTITGNLINGIYITVDSNPDLRPALAGDPPNMFPLSGYNLIYDNGGYEATTLINDDGSEIFINDGFIRLGDGCNQIMDDRNQDQNLIETLLLMNSNPLIPVSTIKADTNYWSEINYDPSGRFGNLTVNYIPYLTEPCIIPQAGGQMLVTQSSTGDVIDTLYSSGVDVGTLTGIDALYAQADQYYVTAQTKQAKTFYEQIITDYPDDPKSIYAYSAVFMLTRLSGDSTQFFALRELYQQRLTTITDTLLIKTLSQLSALCFVNEQDYQSAINYFEEIMSSNPNTDAALFAEIDALTTSMIAGSDTTQLGKGINSKILVKGTADYLSKVNSLLKGKFGYQKPEEEQIVPEQYFLYQNYPNPFNPTTSIKFDLPQAGNVELTVYDILGREVKQLLNETKPAGSYEVTFNASNLASGVYIYSIKSNDFTASKKIILLK